MIESPGALYKLMILYMTDRADAPLWAGVIADFIVARGYTSYFRMQETLFEMTDGGLLRAEPKDHSTRYTLTGAGVTTLSCFDSEISPDIRREIDDYLRENRIGIREDADIRATYRWTSADGYEVHCIAAENGVTQIDLVFSVPTEDAAREICANWRGRTADVYRSILQILTD